MNSITHCGATPRSACLVFLIWALHSVAAWGQPSVLPDPLDLGSVDVGATNSEIVQLRNFTGSPLAIVSVQAAQAPFQQIFSNCQPLPFTLNNLDTCSLEYEFAPSAAGVFDQSLEVGWQAGPSNSGTVFINLEGVGSGPELTVTPDPLDFGLARVNTVAGPLSVTLTNTGQATLDVQSIDSAVQPFAFAGGSCPQPPFSLPPNTGNSCTLDVEFAPFNTGPEMQQLAVVSNATGPSSAINLEGEGVAPDIMLIPTTIDFGGVGVGASAGAILQIINGGSWPLDVFGISAGTPLLPVFSMLPGICGLPPFQVPPGAMCDLVFEFQPTATGPLQQTVTLDHNAFTGSGSFVLQGAGLDLSIDVSPGQLDFGVVDVGDTAPAQSVTLLNTGSEPLDVTFSFSTIPFNNPFHLQSGSCPDPVTLQPASSCRMEYTFAPTEPGQFVLGVRVESGAATSPDAYSVIGETPPDMIFADGFETSP